MEKLVVPLDLKFAIRKEKKVVTDLTKNYFYKSSVYQHDKITDISMFYKPIAIYFDSEALKSLKKISLTFILFFIKIFLFSQSYKITFFCDSLNSGFTKDQELCSAAYYLYTHPDSAKLDSVRKLTNVVMGRNTKFIENYFYKSGVPKVKDYNYDCVKHFWVIAIHSIDERQFQLDLIKEVAKRGINACDFKDMYATLVDKRKVLDGEQQIYGSQFDMDSAGHIKILPIQDSVKVNERRASVGLIPIEKYIYAITHMSIK